MPPQVAGLWILLGIAIGAALAWIVIVKLWEDGLRRRGRLAWANAQAEAAGAGQLDLDATLVDDSTK